MSLWDALSGKLLQKFEGHTDTIMDSTCSSVLPSCVGVHTTWLLLAVQFDSISNRVVSAGYDNTVKVWNAMTGEMVHDFAQPRSVPRACACCCLHGLHSTSMIVAAWLPPSTWTGLPVSRLRTFLPCTGPRCRALLALP